MEIITVVNSHFYHFLYRLLLAYQKNGTQNPGRTQDSCLYEFPRPMENLGPYEDSRIYEDPGPYEDPGVQNNPGPYEDPGSYDDPRPVLSLLLNRVFG